MAPEGAILHPTANNDCPSHMWQPHRFAATRDTATFRMPSQSDPTKPRSMRALSVPTNAPGQQANPLLPCRGAASRFRSLSLGAGTFAPFPALISRSKFGSLLEKLAVTPRQPQRKVRKRECARIVSSPQDCLSISVVDLSLNFRVLLVNLSALKVCMFKLRLRNFGRDDFTTLLQGRVWYLNTQQPSPPYDQR